MTTCASCGHEHQGPRLAFICIGCPCQELPGKETREPLPPSIKVLTKSQLINLLVLKHNETVLLRASERWMREIVAELLSETEQGNSPSLGVLAKLRAAIEEERS